MCVTKKKKKRDNKNIDWCQLTHLRRLSNERTWNKLAEKSVERCGFHLLYNPQGAIKVEWHIILDSEWFFHIVGFCILNKNFEAQSGTKIILIVNLSTNSPHYA